MWSDNISSGKVERNKLHTQTQKKTWYEYQHLLLSSSSGWRLGRLRSSQQQCLARIATKQSQMANDISGAEPRELLCNCRSCNPTRGGNRHVNHRTTMLHNKWNYHTNFLQLHLCEIQITQHSTRWNPKWLLNIWNKNYCNLHEINCCTLLTSNPHTHNYTYTLTFYHIYNVFHACQIVCIST